jgi:ABC-type oligopeptide transport system ATPase subunit
MIKYILGHFHPERGAPTLSITHDMARAGKISGRIAMIHIGKFVWRGPARAHA